MIQTEITDTKLEMQPSKISIHTGFLSYTTGWTTYVIHPGIFIENFIMAEIFQPSDKIKLICKFKSALKGHYLPNRKYLLPIKTIRYD